VWDEAIPAAQAGKTVGGRRNERRGARRAAVTASG
jgi:hypothetical protein